MNWNKHPILCLYRTGENPWRRFLDEVLIQEGYLCSDSLELDGIPDLDEALDGRALVSISADALTPVECERLSLFVRQGGRAILLRPPAELIDALRLAVEERPEAFYGQAPPGYLRFGDHAWASHHADSAIQCFASNSLWRIEGAREIARYSPNRGTPGTYPTIVEQECGQGQVTVFWFDPASAIVRCRQGDPRLASTGDRPDADLDGMHKTAGLLFGQLEHPMHEVPQADVLADVIVGVVRGLTDGVFPLPRLWHLPDDGPAMLLLDGDSDGFGWDTYDRIAAACAEYHVPYTVNMLTRDFEGRGISHAEVDGIFAAGNDIELHYQFSTSLPGLEDVREIIPEQCKAFREYTNGRPAVGARGHSLIWPGYTAVAEALADAGVALDASFCPPRGFQYGYGTGSGRAARMMTLEGRLLPVLQQANIFMDDLLLTHKWLAPPLTADQIPELVSRVVEDSASRYHGVINACVHASAAATGERGEAQMVLLRALLDAGKRHGLPSLTVRDWVAFQEARRQLNLFWDGASWRVEARKPLRGITLHSPADSGTRRQGLTWRAETVSLEAGEGCLCG